MAAACYSSSQAGCGTAPLKSFSPSFEGNAGGLTALDCAHLVPLLTGGLLTQSNALDGTEPKPRIDRLGSLTDLRVPRAVRIMHVYVHCVAETSTRDELDRHTGSGSACQGETCCGKHSVLLCTTHDVSLRTCSGPSGSHQPCVDRVCDARPAVYIRNCGLRADRVDSHAAGVPDVGPTAACLSFGKGSLVAPDRRLRLHELALKTCSISRN